LLMMDKINQMVKRKMRNNWEWNQMVKRKMRNNWEWIRGTI
jgi:hypothetical protein